MKEDTKGLTAKKSEDFSEWYTQVIQKAELADYSSVKGFMVIRTNGYSLWENIQKNFDRAIKKLGVKNAYFPLLIPESFFKKEAEHAEGFSPEVAWVDTKGEERLAIRPTSETIMYDSYSKWIRSWRDLPLRINQWVNVLRWETKTTRLFLRTREFLWQEGHCVYETQKECQKETMIYLNEYKKLCEEFLAIHVLDGRKTQGEKFAGAVNTYSIEAFMPDGRALQMATSHDLGQNFAKSFNIKFIDKDAKEKYVWQNSWGISTRTIGALTMVHGDDNGIIVPPKLAENKIAIIPIIFKENREKILKKCKEIASLLKKFNPILDDRDGYSSGWKFHEWEMKGIPIRIEIGPNDISKKQVVIARRDTAKKEFIKETLLGEKVDEILMDIQKSLYEKSKNSVLNNIKKCKSISEARKTINDRKIGLVEMCDTEKCEEILKEKTGGAKTLNIPFEQPKKLESCIVCGKKARYEVRIGKSY